MTTARNLYAAEVAEVVELSFQRIALFIPSFCCAAAEEPTSHAWRLGGYKKRRIDSGSVQS